MPTGLLDDRVDRVSVLHSELQRRLVFLDAFLVIQKLDRARDHAHALEVDGKYLFELDCFLDLEQSCIRLDGFETRRGEAAVTALKLKEYEGYRDYNILWAGCIRASASGEIFREDTAGARKMQKYLEISKVTRTYSDCRPPS